MPYSGRPAQPRTARYSPAPAEPMTRSCWSDVDDLLEADDVRLERGEVGQQQRQPLVPAVGQVEDVERRDVEAIHRLRPRPARGPAGRTRTSTRDPPPTRPGSARRGPRRRDGRSPARAPSRRPAAGLVGLVEALEDPGLVGPRDADPVVLDRHDHLVVRRGHADDDLAPVGAELDRVVEEVDEHLPEPVLVAADGGHARPGPPSRRSTPCRSANSRSRSTDATASRPRSTSSSMHEGTARSRSATGRAARSTIWTRWSVSTSILRDPVAHPGRDRLAGAVGLADERLGEQADRRQRGPQLVRQVVDELRPDPLEPAQLGDVLHDEPDPATRRAAGADDERRPVVRAERSARRRPAPLSRAGSRDRLDRRVDEGLDRAPADERARRPAEELVGGQVRDVDPQVVVEADDPDADDVEQRDPVALDLDRRPLRGLGPVEQDPDALLDVDAVRVDRDRRIVTGRREELPDATERPAPDDRQRDRDPERDRPGR